MAFEFNYYANTIRVNSGESLIIGSTGALIPASGTTGQRPAVPAAGMFRYNSTTSGLEYYNGSTWNPILTSSTLVLDPGSVGSPSLTFTGDLNTGIWSPGADNIAVSTGGAEFFRIDEFGVVRIGGAPGNESVQIGNVVLGVNYVRLSGAVTTGSPIIAVAGGDTNISARHQTKGTGTFDFYTNTSSLQFKIAHTASAVNYIQASGAVTSGMPFLLSTGNDTNVSFSYQTKGTGTHNFYTNQTAVQLQVNHVASATNYVQIGGSNGSSPTINVAGSSTDIGLGIYTKADGPISLLPGGFESLRSSYTNNAVNYVHILGAATGGVLRIKAEGTDTDVELATYSKGSDGLTFGTNASVRQMFVSHTASAVNYINLTGGATGAPGSVTASAVGTDSDINFVITPKGTGVTSSTTFTASTRFISADGSSSAPSYSFTNALGTGLFLASSVTKSATVVSGSAGSTSNGGITTIQGGPGGATTGRGGNVQIAGGIPIDGNGGNLQLYPSDAVTTTATSRNGGALFLLAGAATVAGTGGGITLTAGNTVSGTGGSINLTAGTGGTSGTPGDVNIIAGAGGSSSGNGGAVFIAGGNSPGSGTGGGITIAPGNCGVTGTAANTLIYGGNGGTTSGTGGYVMLLGGVPTNGNGGAVFLNAAAGVGTNRSGGSITITPGVKTGSGTDGSIVLADSAGTTHVQIDTNGVKTSLGVLTTPTTLTGSLTINTTHFLCIYTGSGGHTATLPNATSSTSQYRRYRFKNKGSGNLVVDATALGQIFTTALVNSITLVVGDVLEIISDGTNWVKIN